MAKVVFDPRVELWRIVDGRNGKPVITGHYKAVDKGGQRTQLEAYRLLKAYMDVRRKDKSG